MPVRKLQPHTSRVVYGAVMTVLSFELFTVLVPQIINAALRLWNAGASLQSPVGVPLGLHYTAVILCTALPLALAVIAAVRFGRPVRPAPRGEMPLSKSVPMFLPIFLLVTVAASLIAGLAAGQETSAMQLPARGAALAVSYLCICLIPAVGEEILFRGTVQSMLQACGPWTAIWGQAILFGAAHSFGAPMLTAAVSGLALGLLYTLTGDLRLGMILHGVNNTIGFWENYAYQYGDGTLATAMIVLLDILILLWSAGAVIYMKRNHWENRLYPIDLSTGHGQLTHSSFFLIFVGCMVLARAVGA